MECGLPPSNEMLRNFAKEIVGTKPGKNWPSCWLKAHSNKVISHYTTGMDASYKKADSAFKYLLYFELLAQKIEQYKLEPEYMYNMDEKGFLIGVLVKAKRIFSKLRYEQSGLRQQIQDGNREWITTIGYICADGTSLSPGLIYQAIPDKFKTLGFKTLTQKNKSDFLPHHQVVGQMTSLDMYG